MNWVDYAVIGLIAVSAIVGYTRGLIRSVFKIASFFIAGFLSMQLYPAVSQILIKTFHLNDKMMGIISENLSKLATSDNFKQAVAMNQAQQPIKMEDLNGLLGSVHLPKTIETMVTNNLAVQANNIAGNMIDSLSRSFSTVVVNIISIMLIFAIITIALMFVQTLLEGIASLPVLNQINHAGGIIFGALEGIIAVYVVFAILTLFASSQFMQDVMTNVNSSTLAKGFYNNNLLLIWAFGKK